MITSDLSTSLTPKQRYDRERYARLRAELLAARPPDPITTLTREEMAYLAGLIDGEGCLYIAAVKETCYPAICVAMTSRAVIDWIAEVLNTGAVQLHNQTNLRRHPHYRPQWRVQVTGKRARLLAEILLPFLRVKDGQAALIASFPTDARRGRGTCRDQATDRERERIRSEVSALNRA